MFAKLIVWRLGTAYRDPEGYERFLRAFAASSMAKLRPYGMLDGFVVRLTDSSILTVNLYESEHRARAAWREVVSLPEYGAAGDLEHIFHLINRGDDLPLVSGVEPVKVKDPQASA